ncbi:alpha/beta hydrolase [Wenzhouxiangella sp. XN79A]|uniref:alpha/beta hydrolase family protein n=1 Tax=Wenzhouxiangella sp. XN79A TaxID=2724193 RepID=UPI00144A9B6C|nr:alpha/beta hydrolase [Wenzhouxiangella sp. XN79A]NKI36126.1 alpha/beta hydrolase [Wenzhouxiangella sp. XN79A]
MMLRSVVLALAAALLSACATAPSGPPDPKSAAEAYLDPQPAPDEVITWGPYARQFGELRMPDGDGPFPVVVVLHGGCWLADYDQGYMAGLADAIRELGFAVWTVGFRRIGEPGGGWPNTLFDVAEGTDYLRRLAETRPLDLERVIALGHSAGGQLALWLAARDRQPADSPFRSPDPLPIDGVIALAAAADLVGLSDRRTCGDAATRLIGGSPDLHPERYTLASPARLVPLDVPQILVNGGRDTTWSEPADTYYDAARSAGAPVRRRVVPEAGHFELVDPRTSAWPVIRDALEELARDTMP